MRSGHSEIHIVFIVYWKTFAQLIALKLCENTILHIFVEDWQYTADGVSITGCLRMLNSVWKLRLHCCPQCCDSSSSYRTVVINNIYLFSTITYKCDVTAAAAELLQQTATSQLQYITENESKCISSRKPHAFADVHFPIPIRNAERVQLDRRLRDVSVLPTLQHVRLCACECTMLVDSM